MSYEWRRSWPLMMMIWAGCLRWVGCQHVIIMGRKSAVGRGKSAAGRGESSTDSKTAQ